MDAPVARRGLIAFLVAALFAATLPTGAVAQGSAPIAVTGSFEDRAEGPGPFELVWGVADPGAHWRLEAAVPGSDDGLRIRLHDADGTEIARSDGRGQATLYDLALSPGRYGIVVDGAAAGSGPATVATSLEPVDFDPEPNETRALAVPIVPGSAVVGRLARRGDEDRFVVRIADGDPGLRDITLESEGEADRNLCVEDVTGSSLQCRGGSGSLQLRDLALPAGEYHLRLRGTADPETPYRLEVGAARPRPTDREAEPNDDFLTASTFDAALGVSGSSDPNDRDFHRVTIEGPLQRWEVRASGPQVLELELVRGVRGAVASSSPRGSGEDAVLRDLLLAPGDHVFSVRTREGAYRLSLTPLGPPDPEAEREPNDQPIRAESYVIGERRTGRLASDEDLDYLRFTLAAQDHVRLTLEQPPDADIDLTLSTGGREELRGRASAPGEAIDLDLWLLPGDYLVRLRPRQPSDGEYSLTSERLDPFQLAADQDPNEGVLAARPAPPSLRIRGDRASLEQDDDWFELPPLAEPSTVTIEHSDARPRLWLYAGIEAAEKLRSEWVEDGRVRVDDVPAGVPLFLQLQPDGPYEVRLDATGWSPASDPREPPIELDLQLETDTVAAYWPSGQRIGGRVVIDNAGADDLELALETTTSHYGWDARVASDSVAVAAGATIEVPLEVLVDPDAWAEFPVQVAVAATSGGGGHRSATATLDATRDAAAVGSHLAWTVPDELLGGLNVASIALGGESLGLVRPDREPFLFDGVTPTGAGFSHDVRELPAEFVVDLAGEAPIPVRGTILNPLAKDMSRSHAIKRFELLLSTDGETWTSVLDEELLPLPIDNAYVLDEAVPATHAMLRVHSTRRERGNSVALGEWKVVAEPGFVPDSMPRNIAAPVRGGHLARHTPFSGAQSHWYGMLDETTRRQTASFDPAVQDELELVVGFADGRAAQITGLTWRDPDGSREETTVDALEVEVGMDGPLGPWQPIGTWPLERSGPGEPMRFALEEPVWARFVRLHAPLPAEGKQVEFPATIEVFERPTDDGYRSILGEWGYTSSMGPYEWLVPREIDTIELDPDAGDTRETATPLAWGDLRADDAEIFEDPDWYRLDVPEGQNTLELELGGTPNVGVRLALQDADGNPRSMERELRPGGVESFRTAVEPGSYYLSVEQPPFNVVFTFDTSGSMGPFLDYVLEGTREFAADVEPGREVAQIIPVGENRPLLSAWSDQPIQLLNAVNNFVPTGDAGASNVETGLLMAADLLADREGTRAILTVADAETGSLNLANDVWAAFAAATPTVYAVHVGASNRPAETRDLMRAWSDGDGGEYSYPTSHAEMERSFERLSTRLRRPALYTLEASTGFVDRRPATLAVLAADEQPMALAPGIGVGLILDTSGSMLERLDGKRRIAIAKSSLQSLIRDGLAEGVPLAMRAFVSTGKSRAARCRTKLTLPLAPLDRSAARKVVKRLKAVKGTGTPIAAALEAVADDLEAVDGMRTIVLVTDGDETCGGDPEAAIEALHASGIEVNLNIVGFALEDEALKERMAAWAAAGGGSYFDASGAEDLAAAIASAVAAPYRVYRPDSDEPVAVGTVGDDGVQLPPGTYRVEVLTDPLLEFGVVELAGNEQRALRLPAADAEG